MEIEVYNPKAHKKAARLGGGKPLSPEVQQMVDAINKNKEGIVVAVPEGKKPATFRQNITGWFVRHDAKLVTATLEDGRLFFQKKVVDTPAKVG